MADDDAILFSDWAEKAVIAYGGAGFIGSHLVGRRIESDGLTVYDNLSTDSREVVPEHLDYMSIESIQAELYMREIP